MGAPVGPKLGSLTMESYFLHLLNKVELVRVNQNKKRKMSDEIRTLEFWRSIIAECLATFFYVFLVCAVNISWTDSPVGHRTNWAVMAFVSGFSMATLSQCFGHISGAHVNPAVTWAFFTAKKISLLRMSLYIIAQCGGSIAGAALLYGVSVPGHQGALGISVAHDALGPWQIFGVEFVLTFLVVFTIFATLDPSRKSLGSDSLSIGIAYLVCCLAGLPASGASMNPARSLGPAFVMNRWKHHWVYWIGPVSGGMLAGLIYEFIFDTKKMGKTIRDAFDELERDSNPEDDYEDPEAKINNKAAAAYSSASGASHSTSGSSTGSGHRSNNTGLTSVHSAAGHYDNYRNNAVITYSPSISRSAFPQSNSLPDATGFNGSMHIHGPTAIPSNNSYHQNNTSYAGIYTTRGSNHTTLRTIPARLDYSGNPVGVAGQTKF